MVESVGIDQLSRARVLEKICDQKRDQTSFLRLRATGQTSVSKIVGRGREYPRPTFARSSRRRAEDPIPASKPEFA